MATILVVDDHPSLRSSIYFVLQSNGFEICGQAESEEEAVKKVVELKPDLVILDASLKGRVDVFAASREIRRIAPSVKIMVLTLFDAPEITKAFRELGIDSYVDKSEGAAKLVAEIRRLFCGAND